MTYIRNLPKYLEELKQPSASINQQFDDKDYVVVGSLATLDASIVFGEGIQTVQVIQADTAAGFKGRPNPVNDRLHNRVQKANALRNVVWLLKEKQIWSG